MDLRGSTVQLLSATFRVPIAVTGICIRETKQQQASTTPAVRQRRMGGSRKITFYGGSKPLRSPVPVADPPTATCGSRELWLASADDLSLACEAANRLARRVEHHARALRKVHQISRCRHDLLPRPVRQVAATASNLPVNLPVKSLEIRLLWGLLLRSVHNGAVFVLTTPRRR